MIKKFTSKSSYKYTLLAMLLVLVIGVTGCQSSDVVAKVDDETITKDELYDILVEQNGEQVLNGLISEKIIDLEAKKQKIKISDKDVEKEIEEMKDKYGGAEAFDQVMAQSGLDIETLKDNIAMNMKIEKLLGPDITITDEELAEYFEEKKDELKESEQVKARHILVATEEEAKEVSEKLGGGEDFGKLAEEYSTDEGSKAAGGDLGFFGKGEMAAEFEESAFSLEVNKVSDPIKTQHGYHIIEVLEKKEAKEANFEEVKDDLKDALLQDKIAAHYGEWYQKKLTEYEVENLLTSK